jgi:hypothetical protein
MPREHPSNFDRDDPQGQEHAHRTQKGLRGPVHTCTEETIYFAEVHPGGEQIPERKLWSHFEYDHEGRLLNRSWRDGSGSEWAVKRTYDSSGRPVLEARFKDGTPEGQSIFEYSADGRLQRVIDDRRPGDPVVFRYAANGSKTKVQTSRAENYMPHFSPGRLRFASLDCPPNLPGGGSAITTYDEHDRPIAVEIRDGAGDLLRRAVRSYDPEGRLEEEKLTHDDLGTVIQQAIPSISLEEQRELLAQTLWDKELLYSVAHRYDSDGRKRLTTRRVLNRQDQIETTCNELGDRILTVTKRTHLGAHEGSTREPQIIEVAQSYKYDEAGNWTESVSSYRSNSDHELKPTSKVIRTLTYF